jgi:hypothetical protein
MEKTRRPTACYVAKGLQSARQVLRVLSTEAASVSISRATAPCFYPHFRILIFACGNLVN